MGSGHGSGRVGQGWAYGVLRTESRVKVGMENRKAVDTKQGSWKQTWVKGDQGLEFQYGVAQSVTSWTDIIFTSSYHHILHYHSKHLQTIGKSHVIYYHIKDSHLGLKQSRELSLTCIMLVWQLANSWMSFKEILIFKVVLKTFSWVLSMLLKTKFAKGYNHCSIFYRAYSHQPVIIPYLLQHFIEDHLLIRMSSNLDQLVAFIQHYNLSLQH